MRKKMILFSLVISLVFIAACGSTLQSGKETPPIINVHTGTDGLKLDFENNMPPSEIFEKGEFQVGVKVSNKGAYNIDNGIIVLSGYDPNYFYMMEYQKSFNLEGRSIYLPSGADDVVILEGKNEGIPQGSQNLPSTFIVSACYKYQTQATQEICVSSEAATDTTKQKVAEVVACTPKSEYSLSGQGAPVIVSKIKQKVIPGISKITIVFDISAENKGNGKVRAQEAYQKDCVGPALAASEIDIVGVVVYLGGKEVPCSRNTLKLGLDETNKMTNYITCKIDIEKQQAYTSPMTIYLDYGYVTSATKSMKVSRV